MNWPDGLRYYDGRPDRGQAPDTTDLTASILGPDGALIAHFPMMFPREQRCAWRRRGRGTMRMPLAGGTAILRKSIQALPSRFREAAHLAQARSGPAGRAAMSCLVAPDPADRDRRTARWFVFGADAGSVERFSAADSLSAMHLDSLHPVRPRPNATTGCGERYRYHSVSQRRPPPDAGCPREVGRS
jgi:hypothetical protein